MTEADNTPVISIAAAGRVHAALEEAGDVRHHLQQLWVDWLIVNKQWFELRLEVTTIAEMDQISADFDTKRDELARRVGAFGLDNIRVGNHREGALQPLSPRWWMFLGYPDYSTAQITAS